MAAKCPKCKSKLISYNGGALRCTNDRCGHIEPGKLPRGARGDRRGNGRS